MTTGLGPERRGRPKIGAREATRHMRRKTGGTRRAGPEREGHAEPGSHPPDSTAGRGAGLYVLVGGRARRAAQPPDARLADGPEGPGPGPAGAPELRGRLHRDDGAGHGGRYTAPAQPG